MGPSKAAQEGGVGLGALWHAWGGKQGVLSLPVRAKLEEMEKQGLVFAAWEVRFFLFAAGLILS